MGSSKPRQLLDIDEMSGFLSNPTSKLVSRWKGDSLVERSAGLNATPPVYKTGGAIQGNAKHVIHQGKSALRVKRRRKLENRLNTQSI